MEQPLPRGRAALPPEVVQASQRRRVLEAMAHVASEKGIADTTIADIVTRAGVARRSFYTLFADKTACYLAGYERSVELLLQAMVAAMPPERDPVENLLAGMRAYVDTLRQSMVHARAYLLESMRAGPQVVAHRERVLRRFETVVRDEYERARAKYPQLQPVSDHAFTGLIGGINELVARELGRGVDDADLAGLEPDVLYLTVAVLGLSAVRPG